MTTTRELRLRSSTHDVLLAGCLAEPTSGPARALLVLISGSGPQDRDESVAGQAPFRDLRRKLAARGFAAVSWDDRGVGASQGDYLTSSSKQLTDDVHTVIGTVVEELTGPPVVLIGHSQGALIAAEVAAHDRRVQGLALLAGAGRPGRDVLLEQHRRICEADGWSEASIEATLRMKETCFDILSRFQDTLDDEARMELRSRLEQIIVDSHVLNGTVSVGAQGVIEDVVDDLMEWEWRFLLGHDPAAPLRKVPCPVFAAAGALDTQINPELDLAAISRALEEGLCTHRVIELIPGLNHLFQRGDSGSPAEYATLGPTFDETIIEPLSVWLATIGHSATPNVTSAVS